MSRIDRTGCAAHAVCEWEASVADQEERGLHAGSDPGREPGKSSRAPWMVERLVVGALAVVGEVEGDHRTMGAGLGNAVSKRTAADIARSDVVTLATVDDLILRPKKSAERRAQRSRAVAAFPL